MKSVFLIVLNFALDQLLKLILEHRLASSQLHSHRLPPEHQLLRARHQQLARNEGRPYRQTDGGLELCAWSSRLTESHEILGRCSRAVFRCRSAHANSVSPSYRKPRGARAVTKAARTCPEVGGGALPQPPSKPSGYSSLRENIPSAVCLPEAPTTKPGLKGSTDVR